MAAPSRSRVLVIVESPTKARTITKFLPKGYTVKASVGHVRDLPNSAKDIPSKYKKLPWSRLGVNIEDGFEPLYVVPKDKKGLVREMKAAVAKSDRIYFATDEDREGESISWHLVELLGPRVPFQRLVFHEITKDAIRESLEAPRGINRDLVRAQETRRIVDRLFGYEVSPLLWKKMVPRLSAGRVQSVAVRLLAERERARIRFTEAAYWGMRARFSKGRSVFAADLVQVAGERVATRKDFDPDTGKLKASPGKSRRALVLLDAHAAKRLEGAVRSGEAIVTSVEEKPFSASPQAPYVTSTLQQEANSKLRFQARHTMRLAQQLYENGFITYMRTDSTVLSGEAKSAARRMIVERFGQGYLSKHVRNYRNKVKNAQEAHEAIRPAGGQFRAIGEVRSGLGVEAARLYEMIWRRTLASQMRNARGTNSTVLIEAGDARFRARGRTIEFPGYLKAYSAEAVPGESRVDARERVLPRMAVGDRLDVRSADASQRRTQPPQRYTEGTLIRELERLGIGRPSTWATIVDLVQARAYAFRRSGSLIPTFTAMAVVALLEEHFTHLTDYEFTAKLEDQLDAIARGELERLDYLRGFYYGNGHKGLRPLIEAGVKQIDPRKVCSLPIGKSKDGVQIEVRIGRYGPFLSDGTSRCSVPAELAPDELDVKKAGEMLLIASKGPAPLGHDSESGEPVFLKQGRYGPFVQLGVTGGKAKVKRASLLRGMEPDTVDLETALKLLSLPLSLGRDPKSGGDVVAANGRYGPFVKCGQEIRSIPSGTSPLEITLAQALALLAQEKSKRRPSARAVTLKLLGGHPVTSKELKVLSGRYGPYVTDGEINASLPRGSRPEELTIDQAVDLLQARAARIAAGGGRKRRTRARKS
jgi:DNA topoisomerase-1